MILVVRPPEPPDLATARTDGLILAASAMAAGTKFTFKAYDIVKPDLAAMQHNKCCYCEKREEQAKYRDVEHYRPKAPYWWLAWTWENLLFSCIDCNREQKRDRFPLSPGDVRLVAHQLAPGGEHPLVLDPSDPGFDPSKEIEFRREAIHGKERWRATLRQGQPTISRTSGPCCKIDFLPIGFARSQGHDDEARLVASVIENKRARA